MEKRVKVLDVGFDNLTMNEAVDIALQLINRERGDEAAPYVMTPNPEIVWKCQKNPRMREAVKNAELSLADGVGIIYGAKILGTPLKSRVTGIGFAESLLDKLAASGGSVFLLGAKPGVAERAAERLSERYPGLIIAGVHDGYFNDDAQVIAQINEAKPDFLIAGLGPPKDLWISDNRERLNVGIAACLGGTLDVFAGEVKRAPVWMQRAGLEWFYRLLKQPSRLGRMMNIPRFMLAVMWRKLSGTTDCT